VRTPPKQTPQNADAARAFRVTVRPSKAESYGVTLDETYGDNGLTLTNTVVRATPAQTGRVLDALLAAVRASGHAPSSLAFGRDKPVQLDEAAGVRLALTLLTTQPITKHQRLRALVAGVNAMSVEETYYWYSKCLGPDAPRARRALRILLADD
jgi:hypothetical protein